MTALMAELGMSIPPMVDLLEEEEEEEPQQQPKKASVAHFAPGPATTSATTGHHGPSGHGGGSELGGAAATRMTRQAARKASVQGMPITNAAATNAVPSSGAGGKTSTKTHHPGPPGRVVPPAGPVPAGRGGGDARVGAGSGAGRGLQNTALAGVSKSRATGGFKSALQHTMDLAAAYESMDY